MKCYIYDEEYVIEILKEKEEEILDEFTNTMSDEQRFKFAQLESIKNTILELNMRVKNY